MPVRTVTLLLTKKCNLRCSYCYVRYSDTSIMSFETAKRIIIKEMAQIHNGTKLVISFLGGEPFSEFHRLKEICEWIWSKNWNTSYYINAVTNGTLLNNEIRTWLIENHHRFYLTLSYDGIIGAQDTNRCNTALIIDLDFFHKYWPNIPIKMTITENNICNLYDNIVYLNQRGILVNDTIADNSSIWKIESLVSLNEQLLKLSTFYLKNQDIKPCDLLNIDLTPVIAPYKKELFSCGAGKDKVTYDVDGKIYQCHLLSPLALNNVQLKKLEMDLNHPNASTRCLNCILDPICTFCPGMSFLSNNTCWIREKKNCAVFKCQVYNACNYQLRKILNKKHSGYKLSNHDICTYLSIKWISNNII